MWRVLYSLDTGNIVRKWHFGCFFKIIVKITSKGGGLYQADVRGDCQIAEGSTPLIPPQLLPHNTHLLTRDTCLACSEIFCASCIKPVTPTAAIWVQL